MLRQRGDVIRNPLQYSVRGAGIVDVARLPARAIRLSRRAFISVMT
jgi:hypothetical protein